MESVPFEVIWGGTIVVPDILLFIDKKRTVISQLRELVKDKKGKVTHVRVMLADSEEREVPLKEVFGPIAYDPYNLSVRVPDAFAALVSRSAPITPIYVIDARFRVHIRHFPEQPATYTVGDQVIFTREQALREMTGHLEIKCFGDIQMIDEAGQMYVSFVANPNAQPARWLLKCSPDELLVVTKRESLGTYGVRIHVGGSMAKARWISILANRHQPRPNPNT